ncbi:hypothetical protein [Plantibacter sp. ME-Dv--P-095]|uniref:hypothetical protein n=1 Tax=Plantibacter sp. ME-Dv--P-095 TaxID=3040299 RepID=UPI002551A1BB|nr:hypothetical protein [Plantibacter sp. ME-Dv--P-095]
MSEPVGVEREAIEHDRDLAWELFEFQPHHPRIPELAMSVLARAPQFTGMIILLSMHREACGDVEEARRLLRELLGRRDRQFLGALRRLRDLEASAGDFTEAMRLGELVLREDPDADWFDHMDLAAAVAMADDPERGWTSMDGAVELAGRTAPEAYAGALGLRALHFLSTGAPPARFLVAAQQAIEADPSETTLSTALAFAYLYDYRPQEAAELLARVLREDPTDEVAQGGMIVARGFLDPIERGAGTMDDLRRAGMGEIAWRILRDKVFGAGLAEALAALDPLLPAELAASLRPPLDRDAARASGGDDKVLAWRDGQRPGSGGLWGDGRPFRLLSGAEVAALDAAIEQHPAAWPQWDAEHEYFTLLFTDDADAYLFEGAGGRLYRRGAGSDDEEIASSLTDWLWDRVAAFGGADARPGRSAVVTGRPPTDES